MKIVFVLVAIAAGLGSALQSGSNSTLQKVTEAPLWAMACVAGMLLPLGLLSALVFGGPVPAMAKFASAPWWAWLGGLFSLLFLFATVVVSPKLGAGVFVAVTVTASTVMSLAMDNWGLMGFETHRAGIGRIVGAVLMIVGVGCIAAF